MVLSKRERYIGIACAITFVILLVNYVFVDPLLARKVELQTEKDNANRELTKNLNFVKRSKEAQPRWTEMRKSGLFTDSSTAEGAMYSSVNSWAREAGFNPPPAVKSDRDEKAKDFHKISFRVTGNGGMQQISRLLWHIQTSSIPIRVTDLTISSRKEGTDDLALSMTISTIYLASDADAPKAASASIAQEVQK